MLSLAQYGSLEGSASSSEGEYETRDGDSLDEFLQDPSGSLDGKRKHLRAKVRSLPDLVSTNLLACLNGVTAVNDHKLNNGCLKPSYFEGVASFVGLTNQQHTSYALELAFRSRKSICIETTAFLQVLFRPEGFYLKPCGAAFESIYSSQVVFCGFMLKMPFSLN